MPYIKPDRRPHARYGPQTAGELNFAITKLIVDYGLHDGYQDINDVLGALEGAKLEYYRRIVVPYEDKKRAENGDVY